MNDKDFARTRFVWLATITYVVLALAWIFLSDQLLALFADVEAIVWLSTAKGVFFVFASAAMFYLALRAVPGRGSDRAQPLLETLSASVGESRFPRWAALSFALLITLGMVAVRHSIGVEFGARPLLILLMFPIVVSALVGGFWPGLVATAVAGVGVAYEFVPAVRSLRIDDSFDLLQWSFLIVNGVVVSIISEVLRRETAKVEVNRRLLDTVVSGTPDAIFVKDREGRYLMANAAAAGFIGKSLTAIIGHDDYALFPPRSAGHIAALDAAVIAAGRTQTHEEKLVNLEGKSLVFSVTKGPVFDAGGEIVGLFGISRDVTDRHQAESEILRLNSELLRRDAERAAELSSAKLELDDLAYALTHNLRAPVRAVDGFAQLLVDEHAAELGAEAMACIAQIRQASTSLATLIEGILALVRCSRGELRRQTIDLSALARRRLDELARREPQRRVGQQVDAGLTAFGDRAMLELALGQLLDNAWKFTRGRDDARIRVFAADAAGERTFCVADNGAGFDMAHAERLYQPFQRLHRQDEFPGVGVGLATAQRIIRRHGGELLAQSAPGAGATFSFSLPLDAPSTEESHDQENDTAR